MIGFPSSSPKTASPFPGRGAGAVRLRLLRAEAAPGRALQDWIEARLDPADRAAVAAHARGPDRLLRAMGRALLAETLAETDVAAAGRGAPRATRDAAGRPRAPAGLHVSLSRCHGPAGPVALAAVGPWPLGVDVEALAACAGAEDFALTAAERAARPGPLQVAALWRLKEAVAKATGLGLGGLPPATLGFALEGAQDARVVEGAPGRWLLRRWQEGDADWPCGAGCGAALAVLLPEGAPPPRISLEEIRPG